MPVDQLRASSVTIGLAAVLAVHAVAVPLLLRYVFLTPREATIVGQVDLLTRREQRDDSWRPMREARAYAAQHPGADLYDEIFFRRRVKFQYPPTSLLAIDDLSLRALNAVSWCAVWITVALTVLTLRGGLRRARRPALRPASPFDAAIAVACAAGLCATFYPLIKGYTLGQIQVWIDALVAAGIWAWCAGRPIAAGAAFGVVCLLKPPLAMIALWALVRRQWRMVAAIVVVAALGVAVSVRAYGLQSHLSYVRVLAFIAERGEAYYPNQSFNGLLNRWLSNGENLTFQRAEFSPPNTFVRAGATAAGAVLLALALMLPAFARRVDERTDLAIMLMTATISSPIAWEHHYGVFAPVLAMLVPVVLDRASSPRQTAAWLVIAFLLLGQYYSIAQRLAATRFNLLQSYVLFGALLLIALAYRAALQAPEQFLRNAAGCVSGSGG